MASPDASDLHTPLLTPDISIERNGRDREVVELSSSTRQRSRSPSPLPYPSPSPSTSSMRFRSATINVSPSPHAPEQASKQHLAPSSPITLMYDGSGTVLTHRPAADKDGMVQYRRDSNRTKYEDAALYVREGEDNEKFASHPNGWLSKMAYHIVHNPLFYTIDFIATVLLLLLALIEDPPVVNIPERWKAVVVTSHSIAELTLLCFIGSNILLRLIWFKPKTFLRNRIMLAALVWIIMYAEALTVLMNQRNHVRVTRCLRPIFFIDTYLMFGVRRVLRQIFQCLKPIFDVIVLLFFMIAIFALMAYYLFATINPKFFDSFLKAFVSLFITLTTANHPDVFMEAYYQVRVSPIFFVLFLLVNLYFFSNVLLAVVYAHFNENEKNKFRKLFLHKREALKIAFDQLSKDGETITFHDFLLFMAAYKPRTPEYIVMCVFKALQKGRGDVSIATSSLTLDEFYNFYNMQNLNWLQTTRGGKAISWHEDFSDKYCILRCIKLLCKVLDRVVHLKFFDPMMALIVIINTLFLVVYTLVISIHCGRDGDDSINPVTQDIGHDCYEGRFDAAYLSIGVSFFFNTVYMVEITVRLLAVGPLQYFRVGWNRFDFVVVVGCLIALCVEADQHQHEVLKYLIVVRPVKLLRLLRLHKRYHIIMNTMVILLHRVISVVLLLFGVTFYFFAIIGMESFRGKVFVGCCEQALYDVGSYYNGTVNSSNVYWLNNFDDILHSYVILYEEMVVNNWFVQMEGFVSETSIWTRIYFILFWVTNIVVVSVVVAFVVEAFVFQIQTSESKKRCKIHQNNLECDCFKSVKLREEVIISMEDIDKLRCDIRNFDDIMRARREQKGKRCWSLNYVIRKLRRIDFDQIQTYPIMFSGKRLSTRDDLNTEMFKSELEGWIEERAMERQRLLEERSSPSPSTKQFRHVVWLKVKAVINLFIE